LIEETIQDCIKEDDTLKQLNELRFRKIVEKSRVDFKFVVDFFNRIIQKNPTLIKYLKSGGVVKNPQTPGQYLKVNINPHSTQLPLKSKVDQEKKGYTREKSLLTVRGEYVLRVKRAG